MKKLTVISLLLMLAATEVSFGSIANVYIASSAAGLGDGSSCVNAKALSFFNTGGSWGAGATQIGSDTNVHLCGSSTITTNTTALTFQGSGTSGHVVTLTFETGAVLTSAAWPQAGGAISLNGKNFIVIDGGSNGTITATANGSGLANTLNSKGVQIDGSHDVEIKNLTITNLYQHTSVSDITPDVTVTGCVYANGFGSNILIHNNTFTDGPWCINLQYNAAADNIQIYNNDISRAPHGITLGASGGSGALTNVAIYGNHISAFGNWGTTADQYHLTGVHIYGSGGTSTIATVNFYNNLFDGTWGNAACPGGTGGCITAFVFVEGGSSDAGMSGLNFFNNVGVSDAPISNGLFGIYSGNSSSIYNNAMVGSTTGSGVCFGSNTSLTGIHFINNVMTTCNQLIAWTGTFASDSPNYNVYGDGGGNAFHCGSNFYNFSQFASWKTCAAHAADANSTAPVSAGLNSSTGVPQSGSAAIGAGTNLTSLGITALDSDKNGLVRPSMGAWDIGAFNSDSTAPTPGGSGVVTVGSVGQTNFTISVTAGTDDTTPQASLQYAYYKSSSNNIASLANLLVNGTLIQSLTTNALSAVITSGLVCGATYFVNVLIQDLAGNQAAYNGTSQATSACSGATAGGGKRR